MSLNTLEQEVIASIELPVLLPTDWGVSLINNDQFHEITQQTPTGYENQDNKRHVLQWVDPENGGAAVVISKSSEVGRAFKRLSLPNQLIDCYVDSHREPGEVPIDDTYQLDRNLGHIVLTRSTDVRAVQIPGINDYLAAYQHVNGTKVPSVIPHTEFGGTLDARDFLPLVAGGHWPLDIHFYENHAPALVIGGETLGQCVVNVAKKYDVTMPDEEADLLASKVDAYADLGYQMYCGARKRIDAFRQSGNSNDLIDELFGLETGNRFNLAYAAWLGVEIPSLV